MLVDSHCHLDYEYEGKTIADLVREAGDAGVEALVTIGTEISSFKIVPKIAAAFPQVFYTLGVHPHEAKTMDDQSIDRLRQAVESDRKKCRAVGEIGLDYHYEHSPPAVQIQRLEEQLALALDLKLPVVVHARDAEADLLPALQTYANKCGTRIPGVIHCFTGTQEFGQTCLDAGFLISFSGILTFEKAEDLHECARVFPLEKLLVETDAPYLAPVPYRGKKCEPFMVQETAKKLAKIKGVSFEDVCRQTTTNAKELFEL